VASSRHNSYNREFDGEAFKIDGIQYRLNHVKVDHLTKECIYHLQKTRKNFEISGTHDSDIEDAAKNNGMRIGKFMNYHYVVYWNHFAEDNQEFFATLAGELDGTIFNESSHSMADSAASSAKNKRKSNDILFNAFELF
jgi:hypothetical protein